MKIRVLSDLHLEFQQWIPPKADADVIVLAGDIDVGIRGIEWARTSFPLSPIVYVPGNHEFYGGHMQDLLEELIAQGRRMGVDVLDRREVVIGGVRFLGVTLWTDFSLYGTDPTSINRAMADAQDGMNDFRLIRFGKGRRFLPTDARAIHVAQVRWLRAQLAEEFLGSTVVVTHHLPHRQSIHPKYQGAP